jgi:hypothetical protein
MAAVRANFPRYMAHRDCDGRSVISRVRPAQRPFAKGASSGMGQTRKSRPLTGKLPLNNGHRPPGPSCPKSAMRRSRGLCKNRRANAGGSELAVHTMGAREACRASHAVGELRRVDNAKLDRKNHKPCWPNRRALMPVDLSRQSEISSHVVSPLFQIFLRSIVVKLRFRPRSPCNLMRHRACEKALTHLPHQNRDH